MALLDWDELLNTKRAFTTRRVQLGQMKTLVCSGAQPRAGDLVLARVDRLGSHRRIELPSGRRSQLYEGDRILVAYGARYAPDQFEAVVPDDLTPCDLVAGGGVAGRVISRHADWAEATKITPIGLLADSDGDVMNLSRWALPPVAIEREPLVIAVVGTSMNAGKTTTASRLIKGLARSGRKVAAAKVTGTGSGGDLWSMSDAGASLVLDFTDHGHATTFQLDQAELVRTAEGLLDHLARSDADVCVVEIADGLLQAETAALLASTSFTSRLDALLFAASDAAGAIFGVERLRRLGLPVIGLTGVLTSSPLGCREAAAETGLPVISSRTLADPAFAEETVARLASAPAPQALRA